MIFWPKGFIEWVDKLSERNRPFAKACMVLLLVLFVVVISLVSGISYKTWIEPPQIVYKHDTTYLHDTIPQFIHDTTQLQTIQPGGKGLQNNGTNNGNQAGGDLSITVNEPTLHQYQLEDIMHRAQDTLTKYNLPKTVIIMSGSGANSGKITAQINDLFTKAGFTVGTGTSTWQFKGVKIFKAPQGDGLHLFIGIQ